VLLSSALAALGVGQTHNLDLLFSPMEVVAVILTVMIVVVLGLDGATNWFEGVLLLAVYIILGIAFFYIPASATRGYDGGVNGAASTTTMTTTAH
jgi:Ca2+:H+ antiporter